MGARSHLITGSLVRAGYGALALLAPKLLFEGAPVMKVQVDDDARYFNRLFGGRDLMVALGTVGAVRRGDSLGKVVATNLFCELTDSVSLVEEVRARRKLDQMTIVGLMFNIGGYATWLRAGKALRRERKALAAAETDE
jgi:hypothetical protein